MIQSSLEAARGYATLPASVSAPSDQIGDNLANAAEEFMATLRAGETEAAKVLNGDGDPHALVMALSESRLAVEATVAVRDRVIEAYQDLIRMPV